MILLRFIDVVNAEKRVSKKIMDEDELCRIFDDDDSNALEEYFENGGTIDDDTILYNCIDVGAEKCYSILINYIKEIPWCVWDYDLLDKTDVYDFIQRGFSIPYDHIFSREPHWFFSYCDCSRRRTKKNCVQDFLKCTVQAHREAVTLLCVAKRMVQPMSSLLRMVAMKYVWALHKSKKIYRCSNCGKERPLSKCV